MKNFVLETNGQKYRVRYDNGLTLKHSLFEQGIYTVHGLGCDVLFTDAETATEYAQEHLDKNRGQWRVFYGNS